MSEYDAQSKPASKQYRDNFDKIFRKSKEERAKRSEERQKEIDEDCGGTGNRKEWSK